jgi:hypothetical protein
VFKLYWQVLDGAAVDYVTYVHLRTADGVNIATWDAETAVSAHGAYHTRFWQPGEFIIDERVLQLPPGVALSSGLQLWAGLYDPLTLERLPVLRDGAADGDGILIDNRINIIAPP